MFAKTLKFGDELHQICQDIERALLKTFPERLAGWALQPWSSTKETVMLQVTNSMRDRLMLSSNTVFLNPLDSHEMIIGVDASECYILPSAHFPVLLTFDCQNTHPNFRPLYNYCKRIRSLLTFDCQNTHPNFGPL